jgi:hypothetical protein
LRMRICARSFKGRLQQLKSDRKLRRFIIYSLSLDAIGYTAVYLLVSHGVLSTWWANTTVSKGMAPTGLALNTLALTGRLWPNRYQTAKWLAYWVPSALAGMICLAFVVTHFGLESIQARAVAGAMLFPFDYLVKRFIVFAKQVRLARFFFRQKFTLVFTGVVLWRRLNLSYSYAMFRMTEMA